jgi:hypothetical protein
MAGRNPSMAMTIADIRFRRGVAPKKEFFTDQGTEVIRPAIRGIERGRRQSSEFGAK